MFLKLKIVFPASKDELDSKVDKRFGRCSYFLVVDTDNMQSEVYENKYKSESQGAGISASQFLIKKDIDAVVASNIGPNAFNVLDSGDVDVYQFSGNIKDGVEKFKGDELDRLNEASNSRGKKGRRGV